MKAIATCVMTLEIVFAGEAARADIIFTDFASGDSYSSSNFYYIGDAVSVFRDDAAVAIPFSVPVGDSYTLQSISIALSYSPTYPSSATATVALDTDNGGVPGSTIDTFTAGSLPAFGSTSDSPIVLNAVRTDVLQGGTTYLIAVSTDYANQLKWNWNTTNATGAIAESVDGGSTWGPSPMAVTFGAFSIEATPQQQSVVPEPSTFVLFSLGVLGSVACRTPAGVVNLLRRLRGSMVGAPRPYAEFNRTFST